MTNEEEHWHPLSKWQEPYHHDILTAFEMNRDPRKVMSNPESVRLRCPLDKMNAEFRCSICLDYMKNTMIVKECLHRFCGACIQKSIRVGKKECPSCRVHVPSRRSLRHDEKFDILVKGILGDTGLLEDSDDEKNNATETPTTFHRSSSYSSRHTTTTRSTADADGEDNNNNNNNNNANNSDQTDASLKKSRPMTLQQAIHEKNVEKNREENNNNNNINQRNNSISNNNTYYNNNHDNHPIMGHNNNNNSNNESSSSNNEDLQEQQQQPEERPRIMIELLRHPKETKLKRLSRQCIRIDHDATISVIKSFLSQKLPPYPKNQFQIQSTYNGNRILLNDCLKLKNVYKNLSDRIQKEHYEECYMVLRYRLAG